MGATMRITWPLLTFLFLTVCSNTDSQTASSVMKNTAPVKSGPSAATTGGSVSGTVPTTTVTVVGGPNGVPPTGDAVKKTEPTPALAPAKPAAAVTTPAVAVTSKPPDKPNSAGPQVPPVTKNSLAPSIIPSGLPPAAASPPAASPAAAVDAASPASPAAAVDAASPASPASPAAAVDAASPASPAAAVDAASPASPAAAASPASPAAAAAVDAASPASPAASPAAAAVDAASPASPAAAASPASPAAAAAVDAASPASPAASPAAAAVDAASPASPAAAAVDAASPASPTAAAAAAPPAAAASPAAAAAATTSTPKNVAPVAPAASSGDSAVTPNPATGQTPEASAPDGTSGTGAPARLMTTEITKVATTGQQSLTLPNIGTKTSQDSKGGAEKTTMALAGRTTEAAGNAVNPSTLTKAGTTAPPLPPQTPTTTTTTTTTTITNTRTTSSTTAAQLKTFLYSLNNGHEKEEEKDLVEVCRRLMVNLQDGNCTLTWQHHNGKIHFNCVEINGKVKTSLATQYYEEITKKPTDHKTLIAILASCGALLIMIVILAVCASHHRKPYNDNQQHLTEELHTVENGYHDNPTLEVMEVQPEMQEKKVALNGEFNDSWIVPIDNLLKEDMADEEDTHL